jgi:PAS domain S-box-containing protein
MQPAVLVVDDHPENLLALEAVLAPVGARIIRAGSGEEALRAVLAEDFAAILLDVQMPGMDGFETAATIRGRQRSAHTPIIFLTALSTDLANVARGYEAGAVDYVLKPFDPLVLRSKVAVFCDLASQRTARERADQLLRAAWDGAPNGIALVNRAGRMLQANPALLSLVGRAADELPAHLDELVPEAHRDALAALRERVAAGAAASGAVELRLCTRNGEELPAAVLASAIPGPEGEPRTLLLQISDLRERLRTREARAALVHEQAARAEAEAISARLAAIAAVTEGLEGHSTTELVPELIERLVRVLGLEGAAMRVVDEHRVIAEASLGKVVDLAALEAASTADPSPHPAGSPANGTTVIEMRVDGRLLGAVAVVGLHSSIPEYARAVALLRNAIERAALILERTRLFERERTIAATLQRDLLPETLPAVPGVAVSAYFTSGGDGVRVGGDWYDAFALPGGRLGVVVGDVAGHGVAAAARMAELRSVARAYALEGHGPAEMLRWMNAYHLAMGSDTMTTLVFAVVEPDRDRARFASAGHMPVLLVPPPDSGSEPHFLDALGPPLGVLELGTYEERDVALPAGGMLGLYTDGLVERRGEVLDLGLERLRRALTGPAGGMGGDVHCARTRALDACLQGASDDDVTLVLVRAQERLGSTATYALTPHPEVLSAMRRHLRRWLGESGAHPGEAAEITIAVNEAMQNAIEHGNAYAVAPITVALDLRGDDVVVVVRDLGHDGSRSPDQERGRGIQLMSALMDDARVDLGGPMGGAVTLRRRLVRAGAGARTG